MAHALWPGFAKGIAEECLRPLMDKYGLEGKGFELHEIRRAWPAALWVVFARLQVLPVAPREGVLVKPALSPPLSTRVGLPPAGTPC